MTRLLCCVLSFAFCVSAHALTGDLRVTLEAPTDVARGTTFTWAASVTNAGPDALPQVTMQLTMGGVSCTDPARPFALAVGERRLFECRYTVPATVPPYGIVATAFAFAEDNRDPNSADNEVHHLVRVISGPDLIAGIERPAPAIPGRAHPITVTYTNFAFTAAERTTVTLTVPRARGFASLPEGCTAVGNVATCEMGRTEAYAGQPGGAGPQKRLMFEIVAPDESYTHFDATVDVQTVPADEHPENNRQTRTLQTYRTALVTDTGDVGANTLRSAIGQINATCRASYELVPCLIAFRLDGDRTIRPQSPLPPITGINLTIVGEGVTIDGSQLREGNGLTFGVPCELDVHGLVVRGFPGHGVHVQTADRCYTLTSGLRTIRENVLTANLRGVFIDTHHPMSVALNQINRNTRAGVFVQRGVVAVGHNGIGANGASGVYLSPETDGSDVFGNFIAWNREAGVAIATGAEWVAVQQNAIFANGQLGIDYGLDGPTEHVPVIAPTIRSARWDEGFGTTTIEVGTADTGGDITIEVYASDSPDPEGQIFLGTTKNRLIVPGDLRGRWITAVTVRTLITTFAVAGDEGITPYWRSATSEFSRPVEVK